MALSPAQIAAKQRLEAKRAGTYVAQPKTLSQITGRVPSLIPPQPSITQTQTQTPTQTQTQMQGPSGTSTTVTTPKLDFGATSFVSKAGQTTTPGARLSTGQTITKEMAKPIQLGAFNVWGQAAKAKEAAAAGTIQQRNDMVINNLLSQGVTTKEGIQQYLQQQAGFAQATPEEQSNTLRALTEQMGIQEVPEDPTGPKSETDQLTEWFQQDVQELTDQFVANKEKMTQDLWKWKSQATNWDAIMEKGGDVEKFNKAILDAKATGQPFTIDDIARSLGWTKEKANDFRVGTTRDPNQLSKYLQVPGIEQEVTSEWQKVLDKYETQYTREKEDLELEMTRMSEDFAEKERRTQKIVDIEVYNNKFMSALTGLSFSTAGTEGIRYVQELAKNTMDDIAKNKERTLSDITRTKLRLIEDYNTLTEEAYKDMQNAISSAKSNFLTQIQGVEDKYGEYSAETMTKIEAVTRQFSKEYRTIQRETQKSVMDGYQMMSSVYNDLNDQNRLQMTYDQDWLKNMGQGSINLSTTSSDFQSRDPRIQSVAINNMVAMVAGALDTEVKGSGTIHMKDIQNAIAQGQTPAQVFSQFGGKNVTSLITASQGKYEVGGGGMTTQYPTTTKDALYMDQDEQKQNLIEYGMLNKDLQYEFGGDGSKSVDCSQLLVNRGKEAGVIPQGTDMTAQTIYNKATKKKSLDTLGQGDLIFYNDGSGIKHVGIAMGAKDKDGNLKILDASSTMGKVSDRWIKVDANNKMLNDKKFTVEGAENWMTPGKTKEGAPMANYDIINYNDPTSRRKMSQVDIERISTEKNKVLNNKDSSIEDILKRSQGGNNVTDSISTPLIKYEQSLNQIIDLAGNMKNFKSGPLLGIFRSNNPYDVQAQTIKSQLTALVPTLARGVYGEVGVLTDNDIRLYQQTVPNLKSTEEKNKAVLAITLNMLAEGYKRRISAVAKLGYDVSGLLGTYENIQGQADAVRNELGIPTKPQGTQGGADALQKLRNIIK